MTLVDISNVLAWICSKGLVTTFGAAVSVDSAWPSRRRDGVMKKELCV